ncbi:hypothetical protein C8R44DRAFT_742773 [Mycena epipterygia]|nr:hypothetical protein C8R44DRAFT_742773 [Mycena epipterygia]
MPRLSRKAAASRKNWMGAVDVVKAGTKRALEILTPRKKKRKTAIETETDAESIPNSPSHDDLTETRSCEDAEFFQSPGPDGLARDFDSLPTDARSQFGFFPTNTHLSPSKSSHSFTQWVLNKLSPSRQTNNPRIFDDNDSVFAHRSPRAARMFDAVSISDSVSENSLDFYLSPDTSNFPPLDCESLDSMSVKSVSRHPTNEYPTNPTPSPAPGLFDWAEQARLRAEKFAKTDGRLREAPTVEAARAALEDITHVLRPKRKNGPGYIDPHLDPFTRSRIEGIQSLLALYTHASSSTQGQWKKASVNVAITMQRGSYCARVIRRLARQYIADRTILPENPYGNWNETLLVNEDLCNELMEYLQELGSTKDENGRVSGITSDKVQEWLTRPETMQKYGITKKISLATSKRYLHALGFRFISPVTGQYVDGHERPDVRAERLNGREAAYATNVYRGHRTIPNDYLKDFEKSGALEKFKKLREL